MSKHSERVGRFVGRPDKNGLDNEVVNEKLTADQRENLVDLILFCYHEWKKQ